MKAEFSFNATMGKKDAKQFNQLIHPQTRPSHISPMRKVKWRLVKKWFNRYEKPQLLNRIITATSKDGKTRIEAQVIDVKVNKDGDHRKVYEIISKPLQQL